MDGVANDASDEEITSRRSSKEWTHHSPLKILKTLLPSIIVKKYAENPVLQVDSDIVKTAGAGMTQRHECVSVLQIPKTNHTK